MPDSKKMMSTLGTDWNGLLAAGPDFAGYQSISRILPDFAGPEPVFKRVKYKYIRQPELAGII